MDLQTAGQGGVLCGSTTRGLCTYCDGSHKLANGEEAGKLYWYDDAGTRHEVADRFSGIRSF